MFYLRGACDELRARKKTRTVAEVVGAPLVVDEVEEHRRLVQVRD